MEPPRSWPVAGEVSSAVEFHALGEDSRALQEKLDA
jgi:hypothetical protein